MSWLNKLADTFIKKSVDRYLLSAFNPWELSRGRLSTTDFDMAVKAFTSWVYRCVTLNYQSVAKLSLKLYSQKESTSKSTARVNQIPVSTKTYDSYLRNTSLKHYIKKKDVDIEEIESHSFLDLMKVVNDQRNEFDLKGETQMFLELTGNSYWYLIPSNMRGENGRYIPAGVWVLPANRVKIIPSKKTFIDHFELRQSGFGEPTRYEPEEIVHFRFPNPNDILYGMGPLQGAANAVDVNQYIKDYEIALFKNQARPDIIFKMEKGITVKEPERERFTKMWQDTYGGVKSSGKVGVLPGGMDLKELGWSPKELSFLVGRGMTMNEIATIFGVPMTKMTTEHVNRANMETGELMYQSDTISPRLRLMEQKITEKLLPIYDSKLFCVFEENIPLDREFRVTERESNLKTGYSSINQERKIDGNEPVTWGEWPILPLNMTPFESASGEDLRELAESISGKIRERLIETKK